MKAQNVFGVLGVAGATMAFTLMVLGPWNIGISEEAKSIKPRIVQPKFASHGCEFTLKNRQARVPDRRVAGGRCDGR